MSGYPDELKELTEYVDAQKPHNDKIPEDGIDWWGLA